MTLPPRPMGEVVQLCILTRDLDTAVRRWADRFGVGPWAIYEFTPDRMRDLRVHGREVAYGMRVALTSWGPLRLELIEPLDDHGIYEESLRLHAGRDHVHHVQVAGDWDGTVAALAALGIEIAQQGTVGEVDFAYFGTQDELGLDLEITRRPAEYRFPPPDAVYPPAD